VGTNRSVVRGNGTRVTTSQICISLKKAANSHATKQPHDSQTQFFNLLFILLLTLEQQSTITARQSLKASALCHMSTLLPSYVLERYSP
jgi:hypothetical protein